MRIFCSICKDIFIPYSEIHVTNCGHLYHGSCISTWIKQHKTCPQCRAKTLQPFRVYFDVEKDSLTDPSTLEHQIESLTDKLREVEKERENWKHECNNVTSLVETLKECTMSLSKKNDVLKNSVKTLKGQVTKLTKKNKAVTELENEVEIWRKKVSTLERIETIVNGSVEDVNKMMTNTPVTELAVRQLCTYVSVLKSQLFKVEEKKFELAKQNKTISKALDQQLRSASCSLEEMKNLRESNHKLQDELKRLKTLYENNKGKVNNDNLHKKDEIVHSLQEPAQQKMKRSCIDIDLDFDDGTDIDTGGKCIGAVKKVGTFNHWEKMVCAGPSRSTIVPIQNSKSYSRILGSNERNVSRSGSVYEFDGFGGRKKLRLGCPTPVEEFEKIKKKKEKICPPVFQHRKIIDYCQLD